MGQGQSQQRPLQQRASTPEPDIDPEERARLQAEERARRVAAAEQRMATNQKKGNGTGTSSAAPKKKLTPLEQLSKENKGWRDADDAAAMRAWN
ncbi:hypothetical protein BCR34DRAFT_601657 [Clohesyomyces aquaticus]|uniref:Uncharacterized protein n=1 Tax=Clohesyomyces aquaticus TaxID=1231657 RepID=A0A1Y1ZM27_9PLEO|nr:hypothetical protein BCR34DRAFT_601657 [Clohesyomyces aquaticus]